MDLNGLRVIVTGASSGLGKETALSLCRAGAKVTCVDVDSAGLTNLVAQAGAFSGEMRSYQADISREEEVIEVVNSAVSPFLWYR